LGKRRESQVLQISDVSIDHIDADKGLIFGLLTMDNGETQEFEAFFNKKYRLISLFTDGSDSNQLDKTPTWVKEEISVNLNEELREERIGALDDGDLDTIKELFS
jgi:hypothetical protein